MTDERDAPTTSELPSGEPPVEVDRERQPATDGATDTTGAEAASPAIEEEPVGDDNIRDGTVGGLMGGPRQQQGQGQGG